MRLCSLKSAALLGLTGLMLTAAGAAQAQAGVASCAKAKANSLDAWLCKDESLMALDKKMARPAALAWLQQHAELATTVLLQQALAQGASFAAGAGL